MIGMKVPVLLAATLLVAGCASSNAAPRASSAQPPQASATSGSATAGSDQSMAGMVMNSGSGPAQPTATALMVCGDDIKHQVQQVLKLAAQPATSSSFANQIFRCTYHLDIGPLVLSVQHSNSRAEAKAYFTDLKRTLPTTDTLAGLGEQAYGTSTGVAVVIKDNETLSVDASKLPAVFGADDQKRTDLAYEIASDVLGCWTGDE